MYVEICAPGDNYKGTIPGKGRPGRVTPIRTNSHDAKYDPSKSRDNHLELITTYIFQEKITTILRISQDGYLTLIDALTAQGNKDTFQSCREFTGKANHELLMADHLF